MIWGVFIFLIAVMIAIYLLYKAVQIIGILSIGIIFICLTSIFYITAAIAGGLLFVLFEQFGGNNFGIIMLVSIIVALVLGASLLNAIVKEAIENKNKVKQWLNKS